jgi:hypothetical protein
VSLNNGESGGKKLRDHLKIDLIVPNTSINQSVAQFFQPQMTSGRRLAQISVRVAMLSAMRIRAGH